MFYLGLRETREGSLRACGLSIATQERFVIFPMVMESLTKHWSKLSLDDREGGGLHLTKERGSKEFIIAVKFLAK